MKYGREHKIKGEVFMKDNEDGTLEIIATDWTEYQLVQNKMYELEYYIESIEFWDKGKDRKYICIFTPEKQLFN